MKNTRIPQIILWLTAFLTLTGLFYGSQRLVTLSDAAIGNFVYILGRISVFVALGYLSAHAYHASSARTIANASLLGLIEHFLLRGSSVAQEFGGWGPWLSLTSPEHSNALFGLVFTGILFLPVLSGVTFIGSLFGRYQNFSPAFSRRYSDSNASGSPAAAPSTKETQKEKA